MGKALIAQGVILAVGIGGAVSDEEWMQVLGVGTAVGGQLFLCSSTAGIQRTRSRCELGVRYMSKRRLQPRRPDPGHGDPPRCERRQSAPPEWLSTHPASDTRISRHLKKTDHQELPRLPHRRELLQSSASRPSSNRTSSRPLSNLPPAKHGSERVPQAPLSSRRLTGISWEQAQSHETAIATPSSADNLVKTSSKPAASA